MLLIPFHMLVLKERKECVYKSDPYCFESKIFKKNIYFSAASIMRLAFDLISYVSSRAEKEMGIMGNGSAAFEPKFEKKICLELSPLEGVLGNFDFNCI